MALAVNQITNIICTIKTNAITTGVAVVTVNIDPSDTVIAPNIALTAVVNRPSIIPVMVNKKSLTNANANNVTTTSRIITSTYVIDFAIAGIEPSIANGKDVIDLTVRIALLTSMAKA